jgi:peptidoglycan-associated lipoprotein
VLESNALRVSSLGRSLAYWRGGNMDKRMVMVGVALAFISGSLFFAGGCSKRQSKVEEVTTPAPLGAPKASGEDEEARRRAEAERQAKLRDSERGQSITDQIQAFESEPVYFDFNSPDLRSQDRPVLEKKATWLKTHPEYSLKIEGHCDERGTEEYNLALGERRAKVVMSYLVSLGVSSGRISTISYGEERPSASGHDEKAWAKNRRAEFRLSK